MKRKLLSPPELRALYETELTATFPPAELKPLAAMEALRAAGCYEPLAFYDEQDGSLLGYALLWTDGQPAGTALLDYLGVVPDKRCGGLGSRIMAELRAYLDGRLLLLEAEAPDGGPDDGLRRRRLGFYQRCGCTLLPYDCALFGVHFCCLALNGGGRDLSAVLAAHQGLYRRHIPPEVHDRCIRLPLAPGEKPPASPPWSEIGPGNVPDAPSRPDDIDTKLL